MGIAMYGLEFYGNVLIFGAMLFGQLFFDFDKDDGDETVDKKPQEEDSTPQPPAPPEHYDASLYSKTIEGTAQDDKLVAESGDTAVAMFGQAGNDQLTGTSGNDYISGGAGNDWVLAQDGDDIIVGGDGNDSLYGALGKDTIYGGAGNDFLSGSRGEDTLYGEAGNDRLEGGGRDDTLYGGDGDDVISSDLIKDWSKMSRGADTLYGGDGNDQLILSNKDTATGGAGADRFTVVELPNSTEAAARIEDFNPSEDVLEIMAQKRTDASGAEIKPALKHSYDSASNTTSVTVDGQIIANLRGEVALTDDNLKLVVTTQRVG